MDDETPPRLFVRMFQFRFALMVEAGTKTQTVRKTPKRMPKPGDRISLREWTGKPYRSPQRVLREATVTAVRKISINSSSLMLDDGLWIHPLTDEFAVADGFSSFRDMVAWFRQTHTLPFEGIVIYWS